MKTTLDIDGRLLAEAEAQAAQEHSSLAQLIEEGLVCGFTRGPVARAAFGVTCRSTRAVADSHLRSTRGAIAVCSTQPANRDNGFVCELPATPGAVASPMMSNLKAVCWKGDRHWLGRLVDHPEVMTQGESLEELEENLRDAYRELLLEDMPPG